MVRKEGEEGGSGAAAVQRSHRPWESSFLFLLHSILLVGTDSSPLSVWAGAAAFSGFTTGSLQLAVAVWSPGDGQHHPACQVLYEPGGSNGALSQEVGPECKTLL